MQQQSCFKRCLSICLSLVCATVLAAAQDLATKGAISGKVADAAGAVIANAKVTLKGATGERTINTDSDGEFEAQNLTPGVYLVKVEQTGFKGLSVPNVVVNVGKTTALKLVLDPGNITEVVEVTAGAATVDTQSTAVGASLNDQLYQNLPLQRNVQSLFYLAPGATDSLGGGRANPSISGGSALDNLYIADGVNITDSAFGGLGVFARTYGSLGTGINTQYIKEVQVKTGGFEPQYGQSQGGIVNIITKSGTTEYHGSAFAYAQPRSFEAQRRFADDLIVNKVGKVLHPEAYDAGFDFSGPVPGLKDKLLFFGSFNPTINRNIVRGAEGSALRGIYGDGTHLRNYTKNYAGKLDWNVSANHQVNFSIFGDPTSTNNGPWRILNIDNTTANSQLGYGTRNISTRYNGTLSSTWTVSAAFSAGRNTFDETGFANFNNILDRTNAQRGNFVAAGLGFYEPTKSDTYRATVDTQKQASFWGNHTFGVGYTYQRAFYSGVRERSGPRYAIPATNADGTYRTPNGVAGQSMNVAFSLREGGAGCTLCPLATVVDKDGKRREAPVYLRIDRAEFGVPAFDTQANYHAAYVQDTWKLNRFVTGLVGWRWEQERLIGAPLPDGSGRNAYSLTGQWSPRLGVTVDPFGKGKTKAYYNYGRFHEYLPLDAAERALSSERDFILARFAPDFTVGADGKRRVRLNSLNTVTPVIDAAHFLSLAAGGTGGSPSISTNTTTPINPGTKLGYTNEHLIGFEQQLPHNLVLSVRYIDRRLGRIIEDAASVSPEAAEAGIGQIYYIGNIGKKLDAAANLVPFKFAAGGPVPAGCLKDAKGAPVYFFDNGANSVCYAGTGIDANANGIVTPDGKADGFPDPVRDYKALEIELNKRFSNGWQLLANYRAAKLNGNFEGHLRNDNGQTDPGISSLFDFTEGILNLLGDQFAVGPLNTDRRHIFNAYGSYAFGRGGYLKGLNTGVGFRVESGVPVSEYLAHPVYLNAGEIPVGGRGKLGRTPTYGKLDLHFDYPWAIKEGVRLTFISDLFNVTNSRKVRTFNQFRESTVEQPNPDFRLPATYHTPFSVRLGVKLEF